MNRSPQVIKKNLAFMNQKNWLAELGKRTVMQEDFYRDHLIPANSGLGWCIDERPVHPHFSNLNNLKPGFVGGAAGWTVLFLINGKMLDEAVYLTQQLYSQMNWGQLEVHTDDEHGHLLGKNEIEQRNSGCGFLGVWQDVAQSIKGLMGDELKIEVMEEPNGEKILTALRKAGAAVVPLAGQHKTNTAHVIVNLIKNKTLDREVLFENNPAFLWDAWATTNEKVRKNFNNLTGKSYSYKQFLKLQMAVHLATGLLLGALHFKEKQNLIILSK